MSSSSSVKLHPGVDTWEARLNPFLDDEQKELIAALAAASYERPYPSFLKGQQDTTATTAAVASDEDRSPTIESLPKFESWFKTIEDSLLDEEEEQIIKLQEDCGENLKLVEGLLTEVSECRNEVSQLGTVYSQLSSQTNALHKTCEKLLDEQWQLKAGVSDITSKLNYFNEYDKIMQKLNSPIFSVKSESFANLLQRLEECIDYLEENSHYKESANYLMLFKSAHSKALLMIKTHFQAIIKSNIALTTSSSASSETKSPVSQLTVESGENRPDAAANTMSSSSSLESLKSASNPLTTNNSFSLLYGKFRAISSGVKLFLEELETRQDKFSECQRILDDCEQVYFSARESLVGQSVMAGVNNLVQQHKNDHCGLFRNGTSMILQVCVDEWDLHGHFFSKRSPRLNSFLQTLCNYLYDALRPLIVHIIHLETLAELCTILKSEILGDKIFSLKTRVEVFEVTCKQMLEDIQERLVYRTQMYIKSDIIGYKPVSGDLAYPEKLIMMRQIAESLSAPGPKSPQLGSDDNVANVDSSEESGIAKMESSRKTSTSTCSSGEHSSSDLSPADMHGMWYPTLRRTLVCLSKLYRCLDIEIFRGLAQETLGCCILSLQYAAGEIRKKKTLTDSQLFFIKHLLILRDQIQPFHSEFYVTETVLDFSKTRIAALGLFSKRERLFTLSKSNALLQFLIDGSPQVTEMTVDSKKDVDMQLKRCCELFVDNCAKLLCEPLMQFLEKAKVIIDVKREGQSKLNLRQQPFANAKKIQDIVGATNKQIKTKLPKLKDDMRLYLANRDTEVILFRPVMVKVLKVFTELNDMLTKYYTDEDRQITGSPSNEEVKLMLS